MEKTDAEIKEELGYDDDRFYPETEPYPLDDQDFFVDEDIYYINPEDDEDEDILAEQNANYNRDIANSIERSRCS